MLLFIAFLVSCGVVIVAFLAFRSVSGLTQAVPDEDRTWLDPLPKPLR